MINIKSILPVILVILGSIGLISYFTASHIHSTRKLNESINKVPEFLSYKSIPFIDLNDKDAVKEEIRKINYYKAIEGETFRFSNLKQKEEELKLRSLAQDNIFEDVSIVDASLTSPWNFRYWVARNWKQYSSNIIVYPYSFNYSYETNETEIERQYKEGAFISLKPEELQDGVGLRTNNTLKIKKARALYDGDIAILNINGNYEELENINYFGEADEWCNYFSNFLYKGVCQGDFETFNNTKTKNPGKTFATWINETEIKKGSLMDNGLPRFKILIVSDYILGSESLIKSKLGSDGIKKIKDYYDNGGIIFVDGKSGYLFEDFGFITKGTYNTTKLVAVENANRKAYIKGCEDTYKPYSKDLDFRKQLTCTFVKRYRKQVCISSTFYIEKKDAQSTIWEIDPNTVDLRIKDAKTGKPRNLTDTDKKNLVLFSHKTNSKNGQLFLLNFNPMFDGGDKDIIFNLLSLALSKELYLNSKVTMNINSTEMPDMPIPAGEAGFNLEVNTLIHNLDDENINNAILYLFLPDNFAWIKDVPNGCTKKSDFGSIPNEIRLKRSFTSKNDYLYCDLKTIATYEKYHFKITILVENYKATQEKYNVLILEPIFTFVDSKNIKHTYADSVKVNCEAAPLLRVAINPDPSAFYPVKGEGQYIDNVVKIENKEQTGASEVEYVGLIPLISPLTDGDDQRKTQWNLKIYVDYYNNKDNNFVVPFPKNNDNVQDFIYTGYLHGKGAVIVAEWDSPVLPVKETIDPSKLSNINITENVDLKGINIGMVTIEKTTEVIKQVNYRQSDRFYKLASQRLMVFVDDSTPEGTKTLYGSSDKIPKEWSFGGDRAKREFLFTRSDLYFYENENYVNPPGANEKIIFSVDKKVSYVKNKSGCVSERGEARAKIIEYGFFTNQDSSKRDIILKPHIYSNELFEYCDLTVIDPTKEGALGQFAENMKVVHYIIPNVEESITKPEHIYKFVVDDDYSGHHEDYPLIKFLYLHSLEFKIRNITCLYGGRITINLGSYSIPDVESVTISPDQIAVYEIIYDKQNKKIVANFRRGLMSNEQFGKDLNLKLNIEGLLSGSTKVRENVKLEVIIEEMKYDISYPPNYERYTQISKVSETFKYESAWSYPALEIKTKLDRNLNGYETMEPFSRYGVYIQELMHRTVYGTAETHFETKPGIVGNGGGFSMISNLGISSIPFIEYLTVGKGQVIPAGPSTSRTTWKDVWGRTWHQPLRTVFPDVPPIPPPLKNFMMSTTYEILQTNGNQILEWASDENVKVHLHVKLLNNYPKYFEITRCAKNQIRFVPNSLPEYHDRDYSAKCSAQLEDSDFSNSKNLFLRQGGYASYGSCFTEEGAIVGGKKVEGEFLKQIEKAKVCADLTNAEKIQQCEEDLKDITTLHKVDKQNLENGISGKKWNYSPTVESYYPKGYIEEDMWDLTHIDYDNNNMDKAYKYHMDNHVPNYDNSIIKPHNTIAIPIYKGLGFSILYDKNNEMNYHGKSKRGWWSDNLQNKDDTLVAGQDQCNVISVDKDSSIKNWVEGKDLKGNNDSKTTTVQKIINNRNKNIYVCLYNRKRPDFGPDTNKKYYTGNVNQNNIVPIIVDLDKNDSRLTNYDCKGEQYTPDNLYTMEENLLVTPTSKDYLYFAANLRGQAKESFNVVMNLVYFDKIKYEGMVKVNEGGRFVYWNPANGPNSFLVVDNPVSVVNAKRNDIDIVNNLFPLTVDTFNSVVYHYYTFRDELKINKEWPFNDYYTNSYGFGDVAISVYVGGIRKSKAVLQPGKTTYARIIFYNNCGFDWAMKDGAIDFEERGSKPISAYDLLERLVHAIRAPTKYNFLTHSVDKEYAKYLSIAPSDHNIEVAPEFFDFENINVVTIRDGFKGEYNLQINVTKDFPDNLRGKPIEIKLELNTTYFEHFPGTKTDPIPKYHTYQVKVPSIYIAVPFKDGQFAGKVLYTSAQAKELDFSLTVGVDWKTEGVKYVNQETIEKMGELSQDHHNLNELDKIWKNLKGNVDFKEQNITNQAKKITFDGIKKDYPLFPKINQGAPDTAEVSILIKSFANQVAYGKSYPISSVKMGYKQWNNRTKSSNGQNPFINGEGPWLTLTYQRTLVEKLPNGDFIEKTNQDLFYEEEGDMRVDFTLKNIGNKDTYGNTQYEIIVNENLTYISNDQGITKTSLKKNSLGQTVLAFDLKAPINKGEMFSSCIYFHYKKYIDSYDALSVDEKKQLPKQLTVVNEAAATVDLTENAGEKQVTQHLRTQLSFAYAQRSINESEIFLDLVVSGRRSNPTVELKPKIKAGNDNMKIKVYKYDLTKYLETKAGIETLYKNSTIPVYPAKDKFAKYVESIEDKPFNKEMSNKNHYVIYVAELENSDYPPKSLAYKQEEIGISSSEVVLIILSIVFFAAAGFFGYLSYRNCVRIKYGSLENKIKSEQLHSLLS